MAKLTEENWEYLSNFERAKYVMRNDDTNFYYLVVFLFLVATSFSQGWEVLGWGLAALAFYILAAFTVSRQNKTAGLAEDRTVQTLWNERKKKR